MKPILCLDFDGVCHAYTSGWKGAAIIPDGVVHGLQKFLENAVEHFEVHIFSSRSHQEGGLKAMQDWFYHFCGVTITDELKFPVVKPPAMISLDDRCLLFTGRWPSIDELLEFKPWNKKEV